MGSGEEDHQKKAPMDHIDVAQRQNAHGFADWCFPGLGSKILGVSVEGLRALLGSQLGLSLPPYLPGTKGKFGNKKMRQPIRPVGHHEFTFDIF